MQQEINSSSNDIIDSSGDLSLLIVDDEKNLRNQLAKAMERRGFIVSTAESVTEGKQLAVDNCPKYAVVDLRLGDGSGLEVVEVLRKARNDVRIIMLTGYGNIPTAVAAIKEGAIDYLAKPADADDVEKALLADPTKKADLQKERGLINLSY